MTCCTCGINPKIRNKGDTKDHFQFAKFRHEEMESQKNDFSNVPQLLCGKTWKNKGGGILLRNWGFNMPIKDQEGVQ